MRCSDFQYPASIARCQHLKVNGIQCASPALKRGKFCYFHHRFEQGRIQVTANRARRARFAVDLPVIEDANSIQMALMQVMRLLIANQIDPKQASLLFYGLQIASSNLLRLRFEPRPQEVVIDLKGVPDTTLGDDAWYTQEFEDEDEESAEENTEENDDQEQEDQEDEEPEGDRDTEAIDINAMAERPSVPQRMHRPYPVYSPPTVRPSIRSQMPPDNHSSLRL